MSRGIKSVLWWFQFAGLVGLCLLSVIAVINENKDKCGVCQTPQIKFFQTIPVSTMGLVIYVGCWLCFLVMPLLFPYIFSVAAGGQLYFFITLVSTKSHCYLCFAAFSVCAFVLLCMSAYRLRTLQIIFLLLPVGFILVHLATGFTSNHILLPDIHATPGIDIEEPVRYAVAEVFLNPACGHCHEVFSNYLPKLEAEFKDKLKVVLYVFFYPQDKLSATSSIIAASAIKKGNFKQVLGRLLETQDKWLSDGKICDVVTDLITCSEAIELAKTKDVRGFLQKCLARANELSIIATPVIYLRYKTKTKLILGASGYEQVAYVIREFLEEKK